MAGCGIGSSTFASLFIAQWPRVSQSGRQREAFEDARVAVEHAFWMFGQKLAALFSPQLWQTIPGGRRAAVMGGMQVVIQIEQRKKRVGFDCANAMPDIGMRLVFGEAA